MKLLWVGDAGCETGFARVSHAVLDRLHATGEYEIEVIAINYRGTTPKRWPYTMHAAQYTTEGMADPLGIAKLKELYDPGYYDAVVLFQDIWNIPQYFAAVPNLRGVMAYYPVDAPNLKESSVLYLSKTSVNATYTQFAAKETGIAAERIFNRITEKAKERGEDSITAVRLVDEEGSIEFSYHRLSNIATKGATKVIPHGIDLDAFKPVKTHIARAEFHNISDEDFVVLNVNRNQPRKRLDLAIRGFADFAQNAPNAKLVFHCFGDNNQGWDLMQLAVYYGVANQVILMHKALGDKKALTDDELCMLYNTADVVINTSGGEGWGLPAFEAAACGRPLIVMDWSATGEIWKDHALLTPVESTRHEPYLMNTLHCQINATELAYQLRELYEDPDYKEKLGKKALAVTQRKEYSWDLIAAEFDKWIKYAAKHPEPSFRLHSLKE